MSSAIVPNNLLFVDMRLSRQIRQIDKALEMNVEKAELNNLKPIARLFDLYRQYYHCEPNLSLATSFIKDRLENGDSDIFIAIDKEQVCGFVQLYPSLCSVIAAKIYILHDLYVDADYRQSGAGKLLMNRATLWATETGAARLDLLTEKDNNAAQRLYEQLGYQKSLEDYFAYSLDVPVSS